jgi:hypothetical protein
MQSYSASRFLPKCAGNVKAAAMPSSTSCLDCALDRLAYRKCWPAALGRLHQVVNPVGPNGLHEIGADGLQLHGRDPPWGAWGIEE